MAALGRAQRWRGQRASRIRCCDAAGREEPINDIQTRRSLGRLFAGAATCPARTCRSSVALKPRCSVRIAFVHAWCRISQLLMTAVRTVRPLPGGRPDTCDVSIRPPAPLCQRRDLGVTAGAGEEGEEGEGAVGTLAKHAPAIARTMGVDICQCATRRPICGWGRRLVRRRQSHSQGPNGKKCSQSWAKMISAP